MKILANHNSTTTIKHALFWLIIFLYHIVIANVDYFSGGYKEVLEVFLFKTILQVILAYTTLKFIMPFFIQKQWLKLLFLTIVFLIVIYMFYHLFRINYLELEYPKSYTNFFKENPSITLLERVFNLKDLLFRSVFFLQPTFLLLIHKFYKNQQKLLKINEQKKATELSVLKNQLNPHFLFNTLNNLYSLTINKSEKAPEIIEKLSNILDYVLYRSSDKFVSLQKEIELIEYYLILEKIRYGDRVEINFNKKIDKNVKIAPLLLLTFIENAFKHGVVQELNKATISILIETDNTSIHFYIKNTKPKQKPLNGAKDPNGIGIKNVEKQLELLYDNSYDLKLKNTQDSFRVNLNLGAK